MVAHGQSIDPFVIRTLPAANPANWFVKGRIDESAEALFAARYLKKDGKGH